MELAELLLGGVGDSDRPVVGILKQPENSGVAAAVHSIEVVVPTHWGFAHAELSRRLRRRMRLTQQAFFTSDGALALTDDPHLGR